MITFASENISILLNGKDVCKNNVFINLKKQYYYGLRN